jgi:hypothetical protein
LLHVFTHDLHFFRTFLIARQFLKRAHLHSFWAKQVGPILQCNSPSPHLIFRSFGNLVRNNRLWYFVSILHSSIAWFD